MAGMKIGERASRAGLDWPTISGAWEKFYEELAEFQEAFCKGMPSNRLRNWETCSLV